MTHAPASAGVDVDVAIIGAGVAGLAAAMRLREAGRSVAVLEAADRIGGRAWTDHPAALGGVAFDHGAQWLHAAERNPLRGLALRAGEAVHPDAARSERLMLEGRPAGPAELAAYRASEIRWEQTVTNRLDGPDISLADAAASLADDPWLATIETWEGAIIAGADADALSLRDWHVNRLEGGNWVAPGGLGAMLGRLLAGEVRLRVAVHGVEQLGAGVAVHSAGGTLRAGAAIVTVSTGVLRAGSIRFRPGLPGQVLRALDGLPMGLLSKVALPAAGADRLGIPGGCDVFARVSPRFAPGMGIVFWPQGQAYATGYVGGRAAWALAGDDAQAADFMRRQVTGSLGAEALRGFGAASVVTSWGSDPLFLGAYAYAVPGEAGARGVLAAPQWEGRLVFAGEACDSAGFAGTVAGAWRSGHAAAGHVLGPPPDAGAGRTPLL